MSRNRRQRPQGAVDWPNLDGFAGLNSTALEPSAFEEYVSKISTTISID